MKIGKMVAMAAVAVLAAGGASYAEEEKKAEGAAAAKKEQAPAEAEPTTAKGWFGLGHQKMESGDLAGAVEAFGKAKEACSPTNKRDRAWAANNVGLCHIRASKWDEARAALEEATGLDETNHIAWNNLGTVYLQQKEHAKAVSAFESAVKVKGEDNKYKANLAYAKSLMEAEGGGAKKEETAPKPAEKKADEKPAEAPKN